MTLKRRDQVQTLRTQAARHAGKAQQKTAHADLIDAQLQRKLAKSETTRQIELGALILHHMRCNPNSDIYAFGWKLLNENVRTFRRYLFEEFALDADPPPGSPSARDAAARATRRAAKALKTAARPKTRPVMLRHWFTAAMN